MEPPLNHAQASPAAPLLELREVSVASAEAPKSALLRGVNWTVASGEFWVIGGLPGSGKSQLLQTAAGLLPPRGGAIRFFGRNSAELSASDLVRTRQRIGFVFADGGRLFNGLTVAQNVALPLCYHRNCQPGAVSEAVEALLALTELKPLAGRLPMRIHRAWRQRLALARALALGPELLVLDNPTGGLDHRQVCWWVESLAQLNAGRAGRASITLVVATDELRPWLTAARQFAFLKDDQWQMVGSPTAAQASTEPLVREMLAEPLPAR